MNMVARFYHFVVLQVVYRIDMIVRFNRLPNRVQVVYRNGTVILVMSMVARFYHFVVLQVVYRIGMIARFNRLPNRLQVVYRIGFRFPEFIMNGKLQNIHPLA